MPSTRSAPFTTAVRMVDRVHYHTSDGGPDAPPARRAGLSKRNQIVLGVSDLTDYGFAIRLNFSHFTRPQTKRGISPFLRNQLRGGSGASGELSALAGFEFHTMNLCTEGNIPQGHAVTGFNRSRIGGHDFLAHRQTFRRDNIAPLAILVKNQSDMSSSVGVIFQTLYDARDIFFVALEIDNAVMPLMSAPGMPGRDPPLVVAAAAFGFLLQQLPEGFAFMKTLGLYPDYKSGSWRSRFRFNDCHARFPFYNRTV